MLDEHLSFDQETFSKMRTSVDFLLATGEGGEGWALAAETGVPFRGPSDVLGCM